MVKIGLRTPSLKRRIKARTTGALKRKVKKAVIPGYGKRGSGWLKKPKKAAYNKVYRKTTTGCLVPILLLLMVTGLIVMKGFEIFSI